MTKWLRYNDAVANPVYQTLIEACVDRLTDRGPGHFEKKEVVKACRLDVFDDSVFRWDYIKLYIEREYHTELVPLVHAYFNRRNIAARLLEMQEAEAAAAREVAVDPDADDPNRAAKLRTIASKYIALGHGKKTAGFCIAIPVNGHFYRKHLETKAARGIGCLTNANDGLHIGQQAGIPELMPKQSLLVPPSTGTVLED